MAFEAFARALEKIGDEYSFNKREERLHARDREEKLADRAESEASQKRLMQAQADISYNEWVKRTEKEKDDELRSLGIEPTPGMSPQEKFKRRTDALQALAESNAVVEAKAKYKGAKAVEDLALNDPNFAEDEKKRRAQILERNRPIIDAHQKDYQEAVSELRAIVANDPNVASQILTPADLAAQKATEFMQKTDALPPAQRDAAYLAAAAPLGAHANDTSHFWQKNNATTPAQAKAMIAADPLMWAQVSGIITPKTEALLAKQAGDALRANGYADRPMITGLLDRISFHVKALTELGVAPKTPEFFKPTETPVTPAAPATPGPVLRAPGSDPFNRNVPIIQIDSASIAEVPVIPAENLTPATPEHWWNRTSYTIDPETGAKVAPPPVAQPNPLVDWSKVPRDGVPQWWSRVTKNAIWNNVPTSTELQPNYSPPSNPFWQRPPNPVVSPGGYQPY